MKKDFRTALLSDAPLVALLGAVNSRAAIDFMLRPDFAVLPSLTIQGISQIRNYNQVTLSIYKTERLQVDIWAASYAEIESVHDALRTRCEAINGTIGTTAFQRLLEDSARDLAVTEVPDGSRVYHRAVDYQIHYQ